MSRRTTRIATPSPQKRPILDKFCALGPLGIGMFIYLSGLIILFFFRVILTLTHMDRFSDTPGYWWLLAVGVRMDTILLSYAIVVPTGLLLAFPQKITSYLKPIIGIWFTIFMCALIYMEVATFPFIDEFDLRPDQKFLEYIHHVHEVATTLWKVYKLELVLGLIILILSARFFWRSTSYILKNQREISFPKRILMFPFVIALLVLGARSTLEHKPANLSTASFSFNHLANEMALNSTYTVLYATYRMLRHEKNPATIYGRIATEEVFERVKKVSVLPGQPIQSEIPFLQKQVSPFKLEKPPNIVIFLQESMGAVDVGCMKGPDITPNLCKLREEGLWFENLYATGTRTVRGIEAVLSSFLPTAARGVIKLGLAQKDFFTAASLFEREGYQTEFIYGGMSNFDEMKGFLIGNGVNEIYDEPTYENPAYLGTWGVSDEDLVRKANEVFKKSHQEGKPFFSLMLSTSNHVPYEFPDGRIELYEQPKQTHFNAIKYADYAIGLLFELAKKEEYYKNTIFLVVADHNWQVRGNDFVPISKFHIPGLLIGPNVPKGNYSLQASQIDLLPTLLHFSGIDSVHPIIGRNLMSLPPETPGRSFMQFGENNAYRVNDDVIILRPYVEPLQFKYQNETLVPATLDPEMARDALAHAYFPWILYSKKLYRLPDLNPSANND